MIDISNISGVWGFAATVCFFVCFIIGSINEQDKISNIIRNLKMNRTVMIWAWSLNLIVFTCALWLGHYAMHTGTTWIKTPLEVTLGSTGCVKLILSTLIVISWCKDRNRIQ